jgi:hypothetical protein
MPAQFTCPNCRHAHRFQAALAGQSMHCHGCGFVFRIPLVPLERAEGVDFTQAGRWLLRLAGGRQFGPVRREIILEWLREGRADGDCLVSPEDSTGWYRVGDVFLQAQLKSRTSTTGRAAPPGMEEAVSPAAIIPASGLLEALEDCADEPPRGRLRPILRWHTEALRALETEAARAGGLLRARGSRLVWLEEERAPRYARTGHEPLDTEAATVSAWLGPQGGEFYCIIPWSRLGRLPHEFLGILPGRLPAPVALRRASEDAFDGGKWIGITGDDRDVMALAAGISQEALAPGIEWDWLSENRLYHMVLVWGVQAIPLGGEKFAHLIQTTERPDANSPAGLRWYLERQSAFWRFARRLNLPGAAGSPVLFASCGARLLAMAADRLREAQDRSADLSSAP